MNVDSTPQENAQLIWDYVLKERPNPTETSRQIDPVLGMSVAIAPVDTDEPDCIELKYDWDRMTHDTYATLRINSDYEASYHKKTYWHEGELSDGTRETVADFGSDHPSTLSELESLALRIRKHKQLPAVKQ